MAHIACERRAIGYSLPRRVVIDQSCQQPTKASSYRRALSRSVFSSLIASPPSPRSLVVGFSVDRKVSRNLLPAVGLPSEFPGQMERLLTVTGLTSVLARRQERRL
jgi:hypothetical protein